MGNNTKNVILFSTILLFLLPTLSSALSFSDLFNFSGHQIESTGSIEPDHHTVYLVSPENGSYTNNDNDTLAFTFNHTGSLTGNVNCTLYLDNIAVNIITNVSANQNTEVYSNRSITETKHNWWVNCTNGTDTESSTEVGGNWSFEADYTEPNITSWTTNGTNASSPTDIMFLVDINESIQFNVTVMDNTTLTYRWFINKVDQNSNQDNFTFNVPGCDTIYNPSDCIWEIHVIITDSTEKETHKEWIISNLSIIQAPDMFDSFSDNKYDSRIDTDPWSRTLNEWVKGQSSSMDISLDRGYVYTTDLIVHTIDTSDSVTLKINSSVSEGTWFIRYRWWPNDPYTASYNSWTGLAFDPITSTNDSAYLKLWNVIDGHWWFYGGPSNVSRNYLSYPYANMVGSQIGSAKVTGTDWHNITIIRDDDGYVYTYLDGAGVRWSLDRNTDIPDSEFYSISLKTYYPYALEIDDIQIYDKKYFPQNPNIYYDDAQDAIIINGHNVTLERISQKINNDTLFDYSTETRTAISYVDLKLIPGTNFHMSGSTLNIDSTFDGEHKIMIGNDVNFIVENSTITSTDEHNYQLIRFGEGFANIAIQIINSTINNTGGLSIDAIDSLYIVDSNLTDLVGSTPINIYFRIPSHKKIIKNSIFKGKTGTESIIFQGGMQFEQVYPLSPGLNIVNTIFEDIKLYSRYDWPYTYSNCRPGGIANLINSDIKLKSFDGTTIRNKYYLDVFVENNTGSPQENAIVSVVNNVDNERYMSENLQMGQSYVIAGDQVSYETCYENDDYRYFWVGSPTNKGQLTNNFPAWMRINQNTLTTTGVDGHTPLHDNITGVLILTDSLEYSASSVTNFTYNITAHKLIYSGNRIATINNKVYPEKTVNIVYPNGSIYYMNGAIESIGFAYDIDPNSSWYRIDPSEYNNTVEITLQPTDDFFINISAIPISDNVTVIINQYNYSVGAGSEIINFSAVADNGNIVNFTVCDFEPSEYYSIDKDDKYFVTRIANTSGCLNFSNSQWDDKYFTIRENMPPEITIDSPLNITYGSDWVWVNTTVDENASWCGVSLNGTQNLSLSTTDSRTWSLNISVPTEGLNNINVFCNNTVGKMNYDYLDFSIDTISGCYPPNEGTWLINDTLYCSGTDIVLSPDTIIGRAGNITFNDSILILNGLNISEYGILTILNSPLEVSIGDGLFILGNMYVNSSDMLVHGHINLNKNLTLYNLTLRMNSTSTLSDTGFYNIEVYSGAYLDVNKIKITRGETSSVYWGRLKVNGVMVMNNSRVEYTSGGNAGGIYIADSTDQTRIYNSVFYDDSGNNIFNLAGAIISIYNLTSGAGASYAITSKGNSIVKLYNSNMLSTTSLAYGGNIYLINTTVAGTWHGTGGGEIWRQWYVDLNITDKSQDPVAFVNISIYNSSGSLEAEDISYLNGSKRLVLTEYTQIATGGGSNRPKTHVTPHTINISKAEYNDNSTIINLTQTESLKLNMILEKKLYCGDTTCNNGETCSTCVSDCGTCSTSSGGSSSGSFVPAPTIIEDNTTDNNSVDIITETTSSDDTTENNTTLSNIADSELRFNTRNRIDTVRQKLTDNDKSALTILNDAEDAFAKGDYEKAYKLASDAESIILNDSSLLTTTSNSNVREIQYLILSLFTLMFVLYTIISKKRYDLKSLVYSLFNQKSKDELDDTPYKIKKSTDPLTVQEKPQEVLPFTETISPTTYSAPVIGPNNIPTIESDQDINTSAPETQQPQTENTDMDDITLRIEKLRQKLIDEN